MRTQNFPVDAVNPPSYPEPNPILNSNPPSYPEDRGWSGIGEGVEETISPALVFESAFESGNLAQALRVGDRAYELTLAKDLHTAGHTQWFYFGIGGMEPGAPYHFSIVNLEKGDSLYNYGMLPLFYSTKQHIPKAL